MQARPFLYFKSNLAAKYRPLSNFAAFPVSLNLAALPTYASLLSPNIDRTLLPDPLPFPASEQAWQALKADDTDTFRMFLTGGRFSVLSPEVFTGLTTRTEWKKKTPEEYGHAKVAFYNRGGQEMVGAVAKFAGSPVRAARLGYALRTDRELLPEATEAAVWHELLLAKFTQNPAALHVLLGTGTRWIVEHDKGARVVGSHWGGLVNEDGTLTGDNKMGLFLERARAALGGGASHEDIVHTAPTGRGVKRPAPREDATARKKPRLTTLAPTHSCLLLNDNEARVPYEPAFFPQEEADGYFEALMRETPWTTETIKRWNKEIITPRRVYAFSDPDVTYRYIGLSRVGAAWTPTMLAIKERVEAYCGVLFNFCFVNLYRNGKDTIGKHSDDEKALVKGHMIASVSLGTERDLVFTHKTSKQRITVALGNGSLYVMQGKTQKFYKHAIPRRPRVTEPRINLTFRQIKPAV